MDKIDNPYVPALATLGALTGLFFLPALVTAVLIARGAFDQPAMPFLLVGSGLFILFAMVLLIVWVIGRVKVRQMEAFLSSERPLVRWQYTPAEWQAISEARWEDEKEDWKPQLGCMSGLFGLIGLLTGLLLGMEEGLWEAVVAGLGGAALGAAIGALIGAAVAASSHLSARKAYRNPVPGLVALAPHEVLANGDYFRGNGIHRYIQSAQFLPDDPGQLAVQIWAPKIKGPAEEEWLIAVPPHHRKTVEAILPRLTASNQGVES